MSEKIESKNETLVKSRRAFLKGAGTASVGAAISVVATGTAEAQDVAAPKTSGYQETDHVKAYYDAAKF